MMHCDLLCPYFGRDGVCTCLRQSCKGCLFKAFIEYPAYTAFGSRLHLNTSNNGCSSQYPTAPAIRNGA